MRVHMGSVCLKDESAHGFTVFERCCSIGRGSRLHSMLQQWLEQMLGTSIGQFERQHAVVLVLQLMDILLY